jgi:hypothetical protein
MSARLSQEVLDAQYDRESLCLAAFEEHQTPETRGWDVQKKRGAGKMADVISTSRGLVRDLKVREGIIRPGRYIKRLGECSRERVVGLRRLMIQVRRLGPRIQVHWRAWFNIINI